MPVANLQTMKNSLLPAKSFFVAIAFFSLFAFLAVNMHARSSGIASTVPAELLQEKAEAGDHQSQNLPLPSLTVVERVLEIASHFLPISH